MNLVRQLKISSEHSLMIVLHQQLIIDTDQALHNGRHRIAPYSSHSLITARIHLLLLLLLMHQLLLLLLSMEVGELGRGLFHLILRKR